LEKHLARSSICSAKFRNARKELDAINRTDAIGGGEGSTHLITLQWTNQIPAHLNAGALLGNCRALLLQLLDAILAEGTLPSIDRLGDTLGGDTLGDGEQFNTSRWAAGALFGGANAGVKRR
jgi:hypothetical protein